MRTFLTILTTLLLTGLPEQAEAGMIGGAAGANGEDLLSVALSSEHSDEQDVDDANESLLLVMAPSKDGMQSPNVQSPVSASAGLAVCGTDYPLSPPIVAILLVQAEAMPAPPDLTGIFRPPKC